MPDAKDDGTEPSTLLLETSRRVRCPRVDQVAGRVPTVRLARDCSLRDWRLTNEEKEGGRVPVNLVVGAQGRGRHVGSPMVEMYIKSRESYSLHPH